MKSFIQSFLFVFLLGLSASSAACEVSDLLKKAVATVDGHEHHIPNHYSVSLLRMLKDNARLNRPNKFFSARDVFTPKGENAFVVLKSWFNEDGDFQCTYCVPVANVQNESKAFLQVLLNQRAVQDQGMPK